MFIEKVKQVSRLFSVGETLMAPICSRAFPSGLRLSRCTDRCNRAPRACRRPARVGTGAVAR